MKMITIYDESGFEIGEAPERRLEELCTNHMKYIKCLQCNGKGSYENCDDYDLKDLLES